MSFDVRHERDAKHWLVLYAKGIAMGTGDSVPGISGGTIAVITHIYEELIASIGRVDAQALSLLFKGQLGQAWAYVNGTFLLVLATGILSGLLFSANTVLFLLGNYFEALMGFFIGLVLASAYSLNSRTALQSWPNVFAAVLGLTLVLLIALVPQQPANTSYVAIFAYGAIAICAMILPGLSGAFILLILGVYEFILDALTSFQLSYIFVFAAGCAVGLLASARLLAWLLRTHGQLAYGFIIGMLLGSVSALWPWQKVGEVFVDAAGEEHALTMVYLMPHTYLEQTGNSPYWLATILCCASGAALVLLLHAFAKRPDTDKDQRQ